MQSVSLATFAEGCRRTHTGGFRQTFAKASHRKKAMAAAESAAIVLANIQSSESGVRIGGQKLGGRSRQRRRTIATHPASARSAIDPEPGGVRVKVPLLASMLVVCAPVIAPVCAPLLERGAEVTRVAARSCVVVTKPWDSVACDS